MDENPPGVRTLIKIGMTDQGQLAVNITQGTSLDEVLQALLAAGENIRFQVFVKRLQDQVIQVAASMPPGMPPGLVR